MAGPGGYCPGMGMGLPSSHSAPPTPPKTPQHQHTSRSGSSSGPSNVGETSSGRSDCSFGKSSVYNRDHLHTTHSHAHFSGLDASKAQLFSQGSGNANPGVSANQYLGDVSSPSSKMEAAMALQAARNNFASSATTSPTSSSSVSFPPSNVSPASSSGASSAAFFRDDTTTAANMAANLMRPPFGQELFQGHMFAGSAHAQGAMNLQGAQSFYHYGAQGLHPYYMAPR
ncbi:hypothetical protein SK128_027722 [Halocaridina rubra]|uniref:Uncharacterized protein n=1 Tax=Halocaridina rubra TaxID=373956 RepID=A0AAN8XDL5_HALRR